MAGQDTCYYDGRCGMCRRTTRVLRALDWLGRLAFRDMTAVPEVELPVAMEEAMQGMPMRTASGRVLVGFPAVRRALVQTPLGALPAALLYLPGVDAIAARVYRWIALNRRRDAVCAVRAHPYD
jgi:predicted DCC family thiol-disulfide oxidoreductase YuxK